ncbi:MAG: nitrogen regulation protein NR(I) [Oxalobacter sp.]|nr:nitrogen regulation protein NR(I) [Oxalobacter sp.]
MEPVWIVDDDESIRWVLERALSRENIPLRAFCNADEVLAAFETGRPQVLLSDIRMPGTSGLTLLEQAKQRFPGMPIIVMTAFSDLDSAVSAFQGGAFEYLAKPFDLGEVVDLVKRAIKESEVKTEEESQVSRMPDIIGQAPAMQSIFRAIGKLSNSNATVLVTGESGSGKELVARALHRNSPRATRPFIALNVAAIPKDLMESELFGHEKGAFTGAQAMRRGRFEQAEGGTLFLDEIGDMPVEMQTRLLRVLSDGHFYRVGGNQSIKADVRVIAATHQNLEKLVQAGTFREDLFHRLNVIRLRLPPLRERKEDIPVLARHFLEQSAAQMGVEPKRLSESAARFLSQCRLTGNVRQLENLCYWFTVMVAGQTIEVKDMPVDLLEENTQGNLQGDLPSQEAKPFKDDAVPKALSENNEAAVAVSWEKQLERTVREMLDSGQDNLMTSLGDQFERILIHTALQHTRGRKNEAAVLLGIGRNTLTRKIQELNIDSDI